MRNVTTTLYTYDELTPEAQETTVAYFDDINVYFEWWESVYDDAENIGLKITSFDDHNIEGDLTLSAMDVALKIKEEHGEVCETRQTAINFMNDIGHLLIDCASNKDDEDDEDDDDEGETDIEYLEGYEDMEAEFTRALLQDYRIMLMKEYEYLTSEESIVESIRANEYEFTAEGAIFPVE